MLIHRLSKKLICDPAEMSSENLVILPSQNLLFKIILSFGITILVLSILYRTHVVNIQSRDENENLLLQKHFVFR